MLAARSVRGAAQRNKYVNMCPSSPTSTSQWFVDGNDTGQYAIIRTPWTADRGGTITLQRTQYSPTPGVKFDILGRCLCAPLLVVSCWLGVLLVPLQCDGYVI